MSLNCVFKGLSCQLFLIIALLSVFVNQGEASDSEKDSLLGDAADQGGVAHLQLSTSSEEALDDEEAPGKEQELKNCCSGFGQFFQGFCGFVANAGTLVGSSLVSASAIEQSPEKKTTLAWSGFIVVTVAGCCKLINDYMTAQTLSNIQNACVKVGSLLNEAHGALGDALDELEEQSVHKQPSPEQGSGAGAQEDDPETAASKRRQRRLRERQAALVKRHEEVKKLHELL